MRKVGPTMAETRGNWLWKLLRKESRVKLDRLELDLVKGKAEKRSEVGDPAQPDHLRVKTRAK
jgi:hypothetical protein